AQRQTRWGERLRVSAIASAVPQPPAPITATFFMRSPSPCSLVEPDAVLGAGGDPFDVRPVLGDHQKYNRNRSQRNRKRRGVSWRVEHVDEDRQRSRRGYGTERGIAPEHHAEKPNRSRSRHCRSADRQKDAQPRGHSLSAAKTEPDREYVPNNCQKGRNHHPADVSAAPVGG